MAGHLGDFPERRLAAWIQAQESKCWLDEGLGVARGLSGPGPDLGVSEFLSDESMAVPSKMK